MKSFFSRGSEADASEYVWLEMLLQYLSPQKQILTNIWKVFPTSNKM